MLLERRKFRTLGLNIPYDFNDTDFSVSDDLLKSYLDSYEVVSHTLMSHHSPSIYQLHCIIVIISMCLNPSATEKMHVAG